MSFLRIATFFGCVTCLLAQQYGGPAILSRGGQASNTTHSEISFRPYVSANGFYNTGLGTLQLDQNHNVVDSSSYGVSVGLGAYGSHSWKQTTLGLGYHGNFNHYYRHQHYDDLNHLFNLDLEHQFSPRFSMVLRESAGIYSGTFGTFGPNSFLSTTSNTTPGQDIFHNRTVYANSGAAVVYQASPRLSFSMGGHSLLVRYDTNALFGITGASASGDMEYRVTKFSTIGVDYGYSHFSYTNLFGGTDSHSVALDYAIRLSKYWEFSLRGGAFRSETQTLQRVQLNPVVAQLTGETSGIAAAYFQHYGPTIGARLTRSLHNGSLSFSYNRGVSPGNGVILTSTQENAVASYSYTGVHHWNLGGTLSYNSFSSLMQNTRTYRNMALNAGVTHTLWRNDLHLILSVGAARQIGFVNLNRTVSMVSLGLAYSPGDLPLSLW